MNNSGKDNLRPFVKGDSRINRKGRPEGVVSVRQKLKKIFRENPATFEDFLERYLKNPANEKHVVEMLDGKPHQAVDHTTMGKELPQPLLTYVHNNNSNEEAPETTEED